MAVTNNLYPPIIDTYMPAFIIGSNGGGTCRIYFSLSMYNTEDDISGVQVAVRFQDTNLSALDKARYPSEIKAAQLIKDIDKTSRDKYYIELKSEDIEGGFKINQYYNVQIRFNSKQVPASADINSFGKFPQQLENDLFTFQSYFSEWSTICIIGGISTPTLSIPAFESEEGYTVWGISTIQVSGKLVFADNQEDETLRSYRIKLYNDKDELLVDTEDIYADRYVAVNEINYMFKYGFQDGETYHMEVEYTTRNLYTKSQKYDFMIILGTAGALDATLTSITDEENGRIGINIRGNTNEKFTGNITIRRTSSDSNFTLWEDIRTITVEDEILNKTWYDCTIESGVWYKYCAQRRDSLGNRGIVVNLKNPVMIVFDNVYLTAGGEQVNIKFNPKVSSFKRTIPESKTDTIGSKFPFVKRNGYANYREFPLSGTISFHMDVDKILTSRENEYKDTLDFYEEYNYQHRVNPWNDLTYERDYRERVMDFLYRNNVKLFRSATEGNILVKLMNVSFTPNETLGRQIYDFSCTCYEIADCTVENCNRYEIQELGEIDNFLGYQQEFHGQLLDTVPANVNILQYSSQYPNNLVTHYKKHAEAGYTLEIQYIDFLRIEMTGDPYLIYEATPGAPTPISDGVARMISNSSTNYFLGYILNINDIPIVINAEGVYELKGEDIKITSISFPVDTPVNMSYHIVLTQTEDKKQLPKSTNYFRRVGQRWGVFTPYQSVFKEIWNKYYEKYPGMWEQTMISLDSISVEADPGTVVYIAEHGEDSYQKHIIGETCLLSFENIDSSIDGLYFGGIHFEEATAAEAERYNLPDHRYVNTGIVVNSLDEILDPIRGGVYTLNNSSIISNNEEESSLYDELILSLSDNKMKLKAEELTEENKYIWYNNKWWKFTSNHDLLEPVEAIVNYYCNISKGYFTDEI